MDDDTLVQTKCGQLRGIKKESFLNFEYFAFLGIPYAKPPVGDLRFKDPIECEPWLGEKTVTNFGEKCAQFNILTQEFEGSDDCLYLNVYTKHTKSKFGPRPVMVWFHAGAFMHGSGDDVIYGPDYLLNSSNDPVLVTVNYRLGVLGFLNLEDEVAPGNQGLKDQVLALKWVKENIERFGGDSQNITIFGGSAGGASVHYLTMSPLAKNLFHKAISQSGLALNPWATIHDPKQYAYRLCEILGKVTKDSETVVEFLRKIDCITLIKAQNKILTKQEELQHLFPFGPGVDNKSSEPYMPCPIEELVQNGVQIPYLLGSNTNEGIIFLFQNDEDFDELDKNFENYLHPNSSREMKKINLTANEVKKIYFENKVIIKSQKDKYIKCWSDLMFNEGIHRFLKIQQCKNPGHTYAYQFDYDQSSHGDEIMYLFSMREFQVLEKGTVPYTIMERMTKLWTNFALAGKPTLAYNEVINSLWQPIESAQDEQFRYVVLGEQMSMEYKDFQLFPQMEKNFT